MGELLAAMGMAVALPVVLTDERRDVPETRGKPDDRG
jgi:hypothetical protein